MRLSLAQYRDLAAFSQFGSDLDEATRTQLELGSRLTEILKQGQYQPMAFEHQVIAIYAANNGYFNSVAVAEVRAVEEKLHGYMDSQARDVVDEIRSTKDLTPETEAKLKEALEAFKQTL